MSCELAIIGAGPAGLAASEVAAQHGLDVLLIDEQPRPGGQIYRQPPREFKVRDWLADRSYGSGKALLHRVSERSDLCWMLQSGVVGMLPSEGAGGPARFRLLVDGPGGLGEIAAGAVLLAAGCYDMPVIFPGWNLPGVMAAGGIQAFVKSQRLIPGERFVFAGSHPLQLIVAEQIVAAGGEVAAVLFAQPAGRALRLLESPDLPLRHAGKFRLLLGALTRLRRAGVAIRFGETVLRADGDTVLQSITAAPVRPDGSLRRDAGRQIACDRLGVCFGFLASAELARQCGANCNWLPNRGGWIVRHDRWMRSSVPGLFVAGETTGIAGAESAEEQGRLAALGCALDSARIPPATAERLARPLRRRLRGLQRFAGVLSELSWPGHRLFDDLLDGEANLCKCEEVTVGAFRRALDRHPHVTTANAAKLLTRVGMGMCQGRYCQFALTRIMAERLGIPEARVGAFTARFPARPVDIERLVAPPFAGEPAAQRSPNVSD